MLLTTTIACCLLTAWPPEVPMATPVAQVSSLAPPSVRIAKIGPERWRATFAYEPSDASTRCFLAGSFNGWQAHGLQMERTGRTYRATVELGPGVHSYKFVLDGEHWRQDPRNDDREHDGHGGSNSILRLGAEASMPTGGGVAGDGQVEGLALRHDPAAARYRQPVGNGTMIRFRTLAHDVEAVALHAADDSMHPLHLVLSDDRFSWWETTVDHASALTDGLAYTFVVQDGATTVRDTKMYTWSEEQDAMRTPDWAKDAIWYQIMVDRFRNGTTSNDPYPVRPWTSEWYTPSDWEGENGETFYNHFVFRRLYGGDFQGVREKLDYLVDLGVTALYFNPVFQSPSHHKYDATSYVHIDEFYGAGNDYRATSAKEDLMDPSTWTFNSSDQVFLAFLRDAKKRGLRVILDGVFNHVGDSHDAFLDVKKHGEKSRFADWFSVTKWSPFEYDGWAGHGSLPVFNKSDQGIVSEAAKQHIFDVTRRWMDPDGDGDPSDGIDGWRLDVPNEVAQPFWEEWCELVRSINPDAYISGEIWDNAESWLDGRTFDAVMNYPFARVAIAWIANRNDKISASEAERRLAALRMQYPSEATAVLMNLVDSHDTDRMVSMIHNPDRTYDGENREQDDSNYDGSKPGEIAYRRARLIALLQMTYVGAPMVYYGDEAGMWGSDDPTNRKPMIWQDLEPYAVPEENHFMADHHAYYRSVIHLRRAHPALSRGDIRTVLTDDERDVWVFVRSDGNEEVLVALNASEHPQRVEVKDLGDGWSPAFGEGRTFPALELEGISGQVWTRRK